MISEAPPVLSAPDPAPPVARWRSILMVLALLVMPPLLGLVGESRTGATPDAVALPSTVSGLLQVCMLNAVLFLVLAAGVAALGRPSWAELWARSRCGWQAWALGLGYSVAFRIGLGVLLTAAVAFKTLVLFFQGKKLESLEGFRPQIENMLDPTVLRDPVYLLLVTTVVSFVVAGLREELWRAAVFAGLERWRRGILSTWKGRALASALAAVVFGIGHLPQGISGVFLTGTLGFGLGLILLGHRSLWVAVLAHGFFNATSFVLLRVVDAAGLLDQVIGGRP